MVFILLCSRFVCETKQIYYTLCVNMAPNTVQTETHFFIPTTDKSEISKRVIVVFYKSNSSHISKESHVKIFKRYRVEKFVLNVLWKSFDCCIQTLMRKL